jgi:hypothetical protein
VVCWRCYDTGRPAPVIVESPYDTEEMIQERDLREELFRTPLSRWEHAFAGWVSLRVQTKDDDDESIYAEFRHAPRDVFSNRFVHAEQLENPAYQPLSTPAAALLLCGAPSDTLFDQVRYMHSNVFRREQREGRQLVVQLDTRLYNHKKDRSRKKNRALKDRTPSVSPLKLTKGLWSTAERSQQQQAALVLVKEQELEEEENRQYEDRRLLLASASLSLSTTAVEKSIPDSLREQRAPMTLLVSDSRAASKRALSRLLQVVVALAARSHKFVRACPTVLKREALMRKSLARMRHALMFRSFVTLINNVFDERRKRRLALEANARCMRIFRALQARCFDRWHARAAREAKGKRFLRKHLGGIKLYMYTKWKTCWANHAREKECQAIARAFIRRYQLRGVLKCLHALHTHAVGIIKLRKFVRRWINKKLVAAIFAWRDLVERNKRVRNFIRKQLQGMRDHCFELWHERTVEEKTNRQNILTSALYRMRNRVVVASFAAILKFRELVVNARILQRVFRGFSARWRAKELHEHVLVIESERHRAEEMEIDYTVEVVKEFQEKFWAEESPDVSRVVSEPAKRLKHHYKEEIVLREAASRIPSNLRAREKEIEKGGTYALFHPDDIFQAFERFDPERRGVVAHGDLEELLWGILRRPADQSLVSSACVTLAKPFTWAEFKAWFFALQVDDVQPEGRCHIVSMLRNKRFLQDMERREIIRAVKLYAAARAKVLGRDLFRFREDAAPRFECKHCRHGFRLPSQLARHNHIRRKNPLMHACVPCIPPMKREGTVAYQEAKDLLENAHFPKLDVEITNRPQINERTKELRFFWPKHSFVGEYGKCHVRIDLDKVEHVRRGDDLPGEPRPVILVTEHQRTTKRTRSGLKKLHKKEYHSLVLKDKDAYALWHRRLKVVAGSNKRARRLRHEQCDAEREARKKKRAEDLATRSEARRKQLYDETQENAMRRRAQDREQREHDAKQKQLQKAKEELLMKVKNDRLRESRAIVGSSHLVAIAHKFIASSEEAIAAMEAAEAGMLPSSDEEDEFEL